MRLTQNSNWKLVRKRIKLDCS